MKDLVRDCFEGSEPTTRSEWMCLCAIKGSKFCVNEDMMQLAWTKVAPLIDGFANTTCGYREKRYVLFECKDWRRARAITKVFQTVGNIERRKGRLKKAVGHHLPEHYRVLWEIQAGRCYFSGESLGTSFQTARYHVDHLIPLATRSFPYADIPGTNWPVNLALVTPKINRMKGARPPQEFLREVKQMKSFAPRPSRERTLINKRRKRAFFTYMSKHCSENEEDWF